MCNCDGFCGCEDTLVLPGIPGPPGPRGPGGNGYLLYQGTRNDSATPVDISVAGGYDYSLFTTTPANSNIYHRVSFWVEADNAHTITVTTKIAGSTVPNISRKITAPAAFGGKSYVTVSMNWVSIGNAGATQSVNIASDTAGVNPRLRGLDWTAWIV